jgi:hypothetical protein
MLNYWDDALVFTSILDVLRFCSISIVFESAGMRYGHTMLPLQTKRWLIVSAVLILTLCIALLFKMYGMLTPSVLLG